MKNIDMAFAKRIVDGINHHITGFSPVTYESLKRLSKPNHVIMLNSSFSYSDSLDSYYKLLDWAKRKFSIDSEQLYNLTSSVIEQFRTCVYNAFTNAYVPALSTYSDLIYIPVETIEDILIVLKSLHKRKDSDTTGNSEMLYNLFLEKITKAIGKVRVSTCGDEIIVSFGHKSESLSSIRLETIDAIGCKYDQIAAIELANEKLGVSISQRDVHLVDIKWPKDKLMYNNILDENSKPSWVGIITFKDGSWITRSVKLIDEESKEVWTRMVPVANDGFDW